MPRARNPENKSLPKGWVHKHNAYYYNVPKGLEPVWDGKTQFRLGKTLGEAYAEYGRRVTALTQMTPESAPHLGIRNVGDALDHYLVLASPAWREGTTLKNNKQSIRTLKGFLGHLRLKELTEEVVYDYIRARAAFEQSKKEVTQLTIMLDYAVSWNLLKGNPIRDRINWSTFNYLKLAGTRAKFYVTDEEVIRAAIASGHDWMWTFLALKLAIGLRGIDLREMKVKQYVSPAEGEKQPGIWTLIGKDRADQTPRYRIYALKDSMHEEMRRYVAGRDPEAWMFGTKEGGQMTRSNWQGYWDRMMRDYVAAFPGARRFSEQLIRVKVGSDEESHRRAMVLLGHRDEKVTKGFYRLKAEYVPVAG